MTIPGFSRCRPGKGLDKPYYDVHGVTIHGPLNAVILADEIFTGLCHYDRMARRHYPCTKDETCSYCRCKTGKRRKGFVAAISSGTKQPFVLELTDASLNQFEALTADLATLRGLHVRLERRRNKDGSRSKQAMVMVTIVGRVDATKIPPAFDETPHLQKMWGLLDKDDLATPFDNQPLAEGEIPLDDL